MKIRALSFLMSLLMTINASNAAEIYNNNRNKLDLFGKIGGLHHFSSEGDIDGNKTYVRIGFKGESPISDQITGYGQWEYQIQESDTKTPSSSWNSGVAFVGMKFGNTSSFDYGRNYGVIYDIASWTRVLPEFNGSTYNADNFMQFRANGLATYRNQNFFGLVNGLNFALQYQSKNENFGDKNTIDSNKHHHGLLNQNGDGYGASLTYNLDEDLSVGGAISSSKRTTEQIDVTENTHGNNHRAEVYSGGMKYDANNIYLAAQYSQTYNATSFGTSFAEGHSNIYGFANKAKNFEIVAQYQFDFGLRPSVAFLQSKGKGINKVGNQDLVKYVDVGATYYFNKNMSTYMDYKFNLLNEKDFTRQSGINTNDVVALGLIYQF